MTPEKRQVLLTDRETLDGELHSLGFVFVRQTIDEFQGELSIDSELSKGTTITIRFPYLPGKTAVRRSPSSREEYGFLPSTASAPRQPDAPAVAAPSGAAAADGVEGGQGMDGRTLCGNMIFEDYQASRAQFPGSIFAIAITEATRSTASRTGPTSATGTSRTKIWRPCSSSRPYAVAWRRTKRRPRC